MNSGPLTDIFIPLALAFMMASIGLSLSRADFTRVWTQPRATGVGMIAQLVLLPAIAFALCHVLPVTAAVAMGIMLLASCPGGHTSNVFTHLSGGETALAVTCTVLAKIATVFTLPLYINASLIYFGRDAVHMQLSMFDTGLRIASMVLVPIGCGMLVNAYLPRIANALRQPAELISMVLLFGLAATVIAQLGSRFLELVYEVGAICLLLCIVAMLLSYALARAAGLSQPQSKAILFEGGIQNSAFAIVIATSVLKAPDMAVPAVVYAILMNGMGLLFMLFFRYMGARVRDPATS